MSRYAGSEWGFVASVGGTHFRTDYIDRELAEQLAESPAGTREDYLALWLVPPFYMAAGEGEFRARHGNLPLAWDYLRGKQELPEDFLNDPNAWLERVKREEYPTYDVRPVAGTKAWSAKNRAGKHGEYRLNYGNGQVSGTMTTKAEAVRAYHAQRDFDKRNHQTSGDLRVESYDGDGFWMKVKTSEKTDPPHGRNTAGTSVKRGKVIEGVDELFEYINRLGFAGSGSMHYRQQQLGAVYDALLAAAGGDFPFRARFHTHKSEYGFTYPWLGEFEIDGKNGHVVVSMSNVKS